MGMTTCGSALESFCMTISCSRFWIAAEFHARPENRHACRGGAVHMTRCRRYGIIHLRKPNRGNMKPLHAGVKAYSLLIFIASYLQSFVLLFIRLAWGWELVE